MTRPRIFLVLAATLCAAASIVATGVIGPRIWPEPTRSSGLPVLGGPFHLINQDGVAVTEATLKGRPSVMFFGFTYCPEVCPTTLATVSAWLKALGADGDRLNVVFVSIDPERDTPAQLKIYLSSFDSRIRAFTGTLQQVTEMARAYKAYFQKVPLEGGGYTMDHTSTLLLFDRNGDFVELVRYGAPDSEALPKLRALLP
jgi:protein SCO1/2